MRWYGCYCCQGALLRETDLDIALGKPVRETDSAKSNKNTVFYYYK